MLTKEQTLQNRYRIDAVLGQGGMGSVYRAYDSRLDRVCVVKEFSIDPGASGSVPEAFLRSLTAQFWEEAKVLSKLTHPNLPRVTDYFEEGGGYYLAMDLIEGQSLQALIPAGGMPEATLLRYADQLLSVLEYIHSHGVLHRDIKPSNIIIQPDDRAVLVDFGLVKVMEAGGSLDTRSFVHGVGTPQYAPPEQQTGGTDQRSDIYSFGATLYQALTGKTPPSANEQISGVTPLVSIRTYNSRISVATERVVLTAMNLNRSARFPTAAAMRAALAGKVPAEPPAPKPVPAEGKTIVMSASESAAFAPASGVAPPPVATPSRTPPRTPGSVIRPPIITPSASPPTQVESNLILTLAEGVTIEFVRVPASTFKMGSANSDTSANWTEKPQSLIYLDEYLIGRYGVTNMQYAAYAEATGKDWLMREGKENHPVVGVSWDDAVNFCGWASQAVGGRRIQLPSEAQWEKAARGTDGRLYPWGNDPPDDSRIDFHRSIRETTPVTKYSPRGDSPYGIADMVGNTLEWTSSLLKPYPYKVDDGREDPNSRESRVLRGGGFYNGSGSVRTAFRYGGLPAYHLVNSSFRVMTYPTTTP